ncbi:MAG: phosphoribosylpyrophosphate synthetase [Cyclobacteriaceae bacterium]|nr:phosphoribosylpyrophosphate synthetase [Cyclobacteriaceae bacterium]UYN85187.1 MAG: phosphoribosylpyrophosphate synthetase [Cyclobacteriaceae bacterium]
MKTYDSLAGAIKARQQQGYVQDFNLHPEWIECPSLKVRLAPEEFHVDEVHRFEGMTNPDDSAILFAISSTTGMKGLLVDAYGVYADALSPVMVRKLTIDDQTHG